MSKIRVDIDDLKSRLDDMIEDDYVTAEIEIAEDDYLSELRVSAVSIESADTIPYGTLYEVEDELI